MQHRKLRQHPSGTRRNERDRRIAERQPKHRDRSRKCRSFRLGTQRSGEQFQQFRHREDADNLALDIRHRPPDAGSNGVERRRNLDSGSEQPLQHVPDRRYSQQRHLRTDVIRNQRRTRRCQSYPARCDRRDTGRRRPVRRPPKRIHGRRNKCSHQIGNELVSRYSLYIL